MEVLQKYPVKINPNERWKHFGEVEYQMIYWMAIQFWDSNQEIRLINVFYHKHTLWKNTSSQYMALKHSSLYRERILNFILFKIHTF